MFSIIQKRKSTLFWEQVAIGVLLVMGFVLRLRQYLTGRSLWLDEAMLALNIVDRSFAGLFQPLDYDQGAPIGFLLVEKVLNLLFGDHEFVLRLFPFMAGVAALVLFYFLLRRTTTRIGLLAGLALFALGPELIYYSSEVKQYIVDVGVTITLLLLAMPLLEGRAEKKNYTYLGLAGVFSLWFSHPALFILAGLGIGLIIQAFEERSRPKMSMVLIVGLIWTANLGLLYFVSLRGLSQNTFLLDYWGENFMPIPPWSNWGWFSTVFSGLVQNQLGVYAPAGLILVLLILGFISLFNKHKTYGFALLTVFILSLAASALRLYPLGGRLSLFLAPLVVILIGQSIEALQNFIQSPYRLGGVLAILISLYLLYSPADEALHNFINPKYFEHIRPSMSTLSENWEEGDTLFVSNGAVPAFRFYADRYGLGDVYFQTSQAADYSSSESIVADLQALDGNARVWVLIAHVYEKNDFNEKDFLLSTLDSIGEHKREFRSPGTSVYLNLYDLSP